MTQTPLQQQQAAGTMAAPADLEALGPAAGVVRERPRGLHVAGAWAAAALLPAAAMMLLRRRRR